MRCIAKSATEELFVETVGIQPTTDALQVPLARLEHAPPKYRLSDCQAYYIIRTFYSLSGTGFTVQLPRCLVPIPIKCDGQVT